MEDLFKNYVPVVEAAIEKLGLSIENCRTDNPYRWSLTKGSAFVLIQLREGVAFSGKKGMLIMLSPVMEVPEDEKIRNKLLEELMKLNHEASTTLFSLYKDAIYLLSNRFVTGMDANEVLEMLKELGSYGDYFDDKLKAKYGDFIVNHDDKFIVNHDDDSNAR